MKISDEDPVIFRVCKILVKHVDSYIPNLKPPLA